jgi:malate dehydrogenase
VVLVDIPQKLKPTQGKALDILEAGPVLGYDSLVTGTDNFDDTANSDIVVITSGVPRKEGMSRDQLLEINKGIVTQVTRDIAQRSPNAVLICVTNPLDAMVQLAHKVSGFPKQRVMGQAGVLDTARFRTFLAQELNVSVRDVQAYVLGGHGDTMVPLTGYSTVGGVPVAKLIPPDRLNAIVQRTRDGGGEIVKLLGEGSAYYAPSAAVLQMIDAILLDRQQIMPCSVYLEGEYGIHGLFVGVPAKLGARGVEEVVQVELSADEQAQLQKSADAVRELVQAMGL